MMQEKPKQCMLKEKQYTLQMHLGIVATCLYYACHVCICTCTSHGSFI